MNKIEALKAERDGLDVRDAIARYAQSGWESITEDDVQRLKWYGLFLRNPTPGFFMIRVRIPNGMTSSYQLRALGDNREDLWEQRDRSDDPPTGAVAPHPHRVRPRGLRRIG